MATRKKRFLTTIMALFVAPMPPFNLDEEVGGNQALRCRTWLTDFKMFLAASNITNKTRQRALLLYQAGPRVREIFPQFPDSKQKHPQTSLAISGQHVMMTINTGSNINVTGHL